MKILITGTQGQVGSELTTIANQLNYEVIAATRSDLDISDSNKVNGTKSIAQIGHNPGLSFLI